MSLFSKKTTKTTATTLTINGVTQVSKLEWEAKRAEFARNNQKHEVSTFNADAIPTRQLRW